MTTILARRNPAVYELWEMAAALALCGAVDENLFVTTQGEMIYTFAKISPFLKNIRDTNPDFMMSVTTLCERNGKARERLERAEKQIPLFRQKVAELKAEGKIATNRALSSNTPA